MNRRDFNTSLAALAIAPLIPFGQVAAAASQSSVVPAGTYAWAQLIARAQNRCDPAMLARHLGVTPQQATQLFNQLLRDGVLRAPGVTGIATAVKPINATGATPRALPKIRALVSAQAQKDGPVPLVKDVSPCVGSDDTQSEETPHASHAQSVQEIPEIR